MTLDPLDHAALLERVTELAVLISLFSAGLKLGLPLSEPIIAIMLAAATVSILLHGISVRPQSEDASRRLSYGPDSQVFITTTLIPSSGPRS